MAISTTINKKTYAGNDSTTVFSFPYLFYANGDLVVTLTDADGVETTQTIVTHYTVSGAGNPAGGSVTMLTAPATGESVTIERVVDLTTAFSPAAGEPFDPETVETQITRNVMMAQQLDEKTDRTIRQPVSDTVALGELLGAAARADKILAFDSTGQIEYLTSIGTWKGDWATATGYIKYDVVRDAAAGANTNNLYICLEDHTSGTWATDLAATKWQLAINVADVEAAQAAAEAAQTAAEAAQTAAETAETNAETAETNAGNSASAASGSASAAADEVTYAGEWANKAEDSLVSAAAGGDEVDDYSAKHWAAKAAASVGSGVAQASEAEAQAGTATGVYMDPLRVQNKVDYDLTQDQTVTGDRDFQGAVSLTKAAGVIDLDLTADYQPGDSTSFAHINFNADNDGGTGIVFARLVGRIIEDAAGAEEGMFQVWAENGDGSLRNMLQLGTNPSAVSYGELSVNNLRVNGTVVGISSGGFTYATTQTTTSGSSANFTSIPSGVDFIVVMFQSVSMTGSDELLVQIGDAGGIETSGYISAGRHSAADVTSSAGFILRVGSAGNAFSGSMILSRINGNNWHALYGGMVEAAGAAAWGGGRKTVSATLDRLSVVPSGSDSFDGGAVNIMWM